MPLESLNADQLQQKTVASSPRHVIRDESRLSSNKGYVWEYYMLDSIDIIVLYS